jgi:hypothetical protein
LVITILRIVTSVASTFKALIARKGAVMAVQTDTEVVAQNLRFMKQADDAFNSRDLDAMDALHHPEVVAYTTGVAEPTRILPPHRKLIEDLIRAFPDVASTTTPTRSSSVRGSGQRRSAR